MQLAIERFRCSIALGERYTFRRGAPLRWPFIVLGGTDDAAEPVYAGRAEDVDCRILSRDRFLILNRPDELARIVVGAAAATTATAATAYAAPSVSAVVLRRAG